MVLCCVVSTSRARLATSQTANEQLERNLPAFHYLSQQFRTVIVPLYQSLINRCSEEELDIVFGKDREGNANREKFLIRIQALEEQRELSKIEKDYLV